MRLVALLLLLALVALADKRATRPPTRHRAPTPQRVLEPTVQPVAAPPTPRVWQHSVEEYRYYSQLYAERAFFVYKFFPHEGPSFYAAQADMARSRMYARLADYEQESEITSQPTAA